MDMAGSGGLGVHRASLLRELLAPLPKEVLYTIESLSRSKKVMMVKLRLHSKTVP